jgi:DNA-binding transcriptional LysR family regulator
VDKHHLISVFVAVVDANGFAGAARKLEISPSVVTRAINELEEMLGVRLLTRTTRVVRVTEAGARYADVCRRILAELAEADESARGQHGAPQGRITITAPGWFGAKFVTPIVTEYLDQHPQVSASCWFLDRLVNMIEEGVDVAVRFAVLPDSSLQAIPVGRMRVVTCASPAYLARQGTPRTLADLASHNIVSAGAVAPGHELRFSQNGRSRVMKIAAPAGHDHQRVGSGRCGHGLRAHAADALQGGRAAGQRSAARGPVRLRTTCTASARVAPRGALRLATRARLPRSGHRTAARAP